MNDAPTSSLVHYNECTGHLGEPCVCEPPLTTVDEVAALMFACHELEYIDAETGWACGCDEDGFLELSTLDDARTHQAEATMAILRPLLAAEFYEGMADATEKQGVMSPEGFRALALLSRQPLSRPTAEETQ